MDGRDVIITRICACTSAGTLRVIAVIMARNNDRFVDFCYNIIITYIGTGAHVMSLSLASNGFERTAVCAATLGTY